MDADAPQSNITSFEGVLVRRHHKAGDKEIQLLFRTTQGLRLSLTRNLRLVQSMAVGQTYHVSGPEYVLGNKAFIHEPEALLVQRKAKRSKRFWTLVGAGALSPLLITASTFALLTGGEPPKQQPAQQESATNQQATSVAEVPQVEAAATPTTPDPVATTPATTPSVAMPKKKTTTTPVAIQTTQTAAPVVQAPVEPVAEPAQPPVEAATPTEPVPDPTPDPQPTDPAPEVQP